MISGSGSDIPREISSLNAVSNNEPESQSATESMSQQSSSDAPSEQPTDSQVSESQLKQLAARVAPYLKEPERYRYVVTDQADGQYRIEAYQQQDDHTSNRHVFLLDDAADALYLLDSETGEFVQIE